MEEFSRKRSTSSEFGKFIKERHAIHLEFVIVYFVEKISINYYLLLLSRLGKILPRNSGKFMVHVLFLLSSQVLHIND